MPNALNVPRGQLGRLRLLCGILCLLAAACGHQDLVAIKPGGSGGAPSCLFAECNSSGPGHSNQCCDGTRCSSGFCIPIDAGPSCGYPMQPCTNSSSCCTGSCETVAQSADRLCAWNICQGLGQPCAADGDCCSFACGQNACTDTRPPCALQNEKCTNDIDCCSQHCVNNTCSRLGDCTFRGDSCKGNAECCSGNCVNLGATSRCIGCGMVDAYCTNGTQCCSGSCLDSKCAKSCGTKYSYCENYSDCCSNYCIPSLNGPGSCSDYFDQGQTCWIDSNCTPGTTCQYDPTKNASVCTAITSNP